MMNPSFRSFRRAGMVVLLGIGVLTGRAAFADTNVVNEKFWVVDGTDDPATNASSITVSLKKQPMGAFTELAFSYNIDGTNVVPVCVVKGSGEIDLAVPNNPFGGSYFMTGYWDCDAGYVPTMLITNLDIRLKGGREPVVELRGQISNQLSMEAKDFELIVFVPKPQLMQAELSYTLTATADFCVDQVIHTNADNFQVARIGSNYLSPETNENDTARFVTSVSATCVLEFCGGGTSSSTCYGLADQDSLIITNRLPRLGGNRLSLVNSGVSGTNTPTLSVRYMSPSPGELKPQGLEVATADPTVENVNYWGNWRKVKGTYNANKKVTKVKYLLQATTPAALSCNNSF
jgi:hypothetical protein